MAKAIGYICFVFCLFLVSSCNKVSPTIASDQTSLELTIVFKQKSFKLFDDVSANIILKNIGDNSVLVNGRLLFLPIRRPPEALEGLLLITDSSGQQIYLKGFIDYQFPTKDQYIVLSPGQTVEKSISLRSVGYFSQDFKDNETYTVAAIYQSSLEFTQIIDSQELIGWTGEIQSNSDTFQIAP